MSAQLPFGQVAGKRAAATGQTAQVQVAPQELGRLARDRQTEPSPRVASVGAPLELLEGREDPRLCFGGDPDAGVRYRERDGLFGHQAGAHQIGVLRGARDAERDPAPSR